MQVEQERSGSAVVLRLSGDVGEQAPEFENALSHLVRESVADIIVDLSGVDDFRAARVLLSAERLRRDQGALHRLAIVVSSGSRASDRLMLQGIKKMIPIFGNAEEVRDAWETDGFPA